MIKKPGTSAKRESSIFDKKAGEIEFFRFVFCAIILCTHSGHFLEQFLVFPGGSLSVEFFFLVSGYLMMATIEKRKDTSTANIGTETAEFIKRKICAVYPEMVICFIISFGVICFVNQYTPREMAGFFASNIFELLLVQRTGLGTGSVNAIDWYIGTMLLCMVVLYPLIRRYPDMMKTIGLPLLSVALLGWLYQNYSHLRTPHTWVGLTYKGNIRAMAELCLGAECYLITQRIKNINFNFVGKLLLTILKWGCWGLILWYLQDVSLKFRFDMVFVAIFCTAIILAFSQKCLDARLYQNRVVEFLGKISLPLYLCHGSVATYIRDTDHVGIGERRLFIYYCIGAFSLALAVMIAAKAVRKICPAVLQTAKRIFLTAA